jgi:hypothetical protein
MAFNMSPLENKEWVDEAKRGMENALRAKPLAIKEQYLGFCFLHSASKC